MANAINRKWASGIGEDGNPVYAPKNAIVVEGRTVLGPKDKHYRLAEYLPVVDVPPPALEGYHAVPTGWAEGGHAIDRVYEMVANPPQPVYISKAKVERIIDELGKTAEFVAWLNSKAAYIGGWMRGGDAMEYDPTANEGDLASLIAALAIPADAVAGLIEKVRA